MSCIFSIDPIWTCFSSCFCYVEKLFLRQELGTILRAPNVVGATSTNVIIKCLYDQLARYEKPFSVIFKNRLQQLVPEPSELIFKTAESNGIFSGSFVMQCLLDVVWPNSDIDIYTRHHELTLIYYLKRHYFYKTDIHYNDDGCFKTEDAPDYFVQYMYIT